MITHVANQNKFSVNVRAAGKSSSQPQDEENSFGTLRFPFPTSNVSRLHLPMHLQQLNWQTSLDAYLSADLHVALHGQQAC
jgi:hypothetical protein